jgi:hypothetical protein
MPTETDQRVANAKAIVLAVLSGRVNPESDPAAFDEDSVYVSVRITEQHDPEWLLRTLVETEVTSQGVVYVLECLGPLRPRAEALIRPAGNAG